MTDHEIQSLSPSGRFQLQVTPWEAGNSHWVFAPQIVDIESGTCVFVFADQRWSMDRDTWLSDTRLQLVLRKYPGNRTGTGLTVIIDCAQRKAVDAEGREVELDALEAALDAMLERAK